MMSDRETQEVYEEISKHLLEDEEPSKYLQELSKRKIFLNYPFSLLLQLKKTEQSSKYHAEGNVWNHVMLVVDEAAKVREKSKNSLAFMWAALLHDIGKPGTTRMRKGRITSYDHDVEGEKVSREFLEYFMAEEQLIQAVAALVRYHMHILYVLKKLPYADLKGLYQKVDVEEIVLLCLCDRLGRSGADAAAERDNSLEFLETLRSH